MSTVVPTAAQFFADESDVGPEDISQRVEYFHLFYLTIIPIR